MNCTEYGSEKKAKGFLTTPLLHFYLLFAKNLHFKFFGVHYSNIYVLFKLQRIIQTRLEKKRKRYTMNYSETPLYGHLLNTVTSLLWTVCFVPGKEALIFTLHSICLIRSPHYYGQFASSLGKESPYIFSKFSRLNTDTFLCPPVLTGFDCASLSSSTKNYFCGLEY